MEITAIDLPPAYTPVPTHQPTRAGQNLTASESPPSYSALPTQQPAPVTANSPPPTYAAAVQQVSQPRTLRAGNPLPVETRITLVRTQNQPDPIRDRPRSHHTVRTNQRGNGNLPRRQNDPIRDQPRSHHTVRTNQRGNGNLPRRQNATGISIISSNQTGIAARRLRTHPYGYNFAYSKYPVKITCQFCQKRVTTKVKESLDYYCCCFPLCLLAIISWAIAFLLVCICWMCNKYHHTCPECRKKVGVSG